MRFRFGQYRGDAALKTSFASVDAFDIAGALNVINSNGTVRATNVRAVDVKTSFGAVMLQQVSGPIDVENQNGAVEVGSEAANVCQPITVRTSFAPIRVRLSRDASYTVAAATSLGKIESEFPLTSSGSIGRQFKWQHR